MATKKMSYLNNSAEPFLNYLNQWYVDLPVVSFKSLLKDFPSDQTAIFAVDVVHGFCKEGNLASPRVGRIVQPIVELFQQAEQLGINHYVLSQDNHTEDSKEFDIFPRHCVEGSQESKTVQELTDLPHSYKFQVIPKRTINPGIERDLREWLDQHENIRQFIVVGDCTDICVYLFSVFLKSYSVQRDVTLQVIVPANCVDTYDIPVDAAEKLKTLPHPGELLHHFFLYHMAINGIRIVAEIS